MVNDKLAERLSGGKVAYGLTVSWPDPDLVEAIGASGFDFVFIDREHGGLDLRTCAELVRAATCGGMSSLIRISHDEMRGVYKYLDMGAHGLIFPHVMSARDAEVAVKACLFPPEGLRGAMSSSRAARYGTAFTTEEYYRLANNSTWVFPIIEDVEAVDVLDEILAVPGIRGYFVGPGDLSLSRLVAARASVPSVEDLVQRAITAGVEAGRIVAMPAATPSSAISLVEKGVRMVVFRASGLFTSACLDYLSAVPR